MRASPIARTLVIIVTLLLGLASTAAADEFEGRYRVGPTTCTVTPVKMAFEVRWQKGSGHMLFFFDAQTDDGRYVFVSEEKPDGRDRFEFDDARLRTGKFVRADGRVFAVRKAPAEAATGGR